ncbi:homeobox-leucine zipper protein ANTHOCYANINLESS 2-like [Hibiscus syriacus]|uniref:homeobox-leucine zipper protein ANTHOCYANINLESS 2-like n=1 Tax=Hibiscus syriacus TaxID=106335 RepID=UPI001922179E|nr:homeobox-leucine zipper protein ANTHOCYANINLESS 2-like [Hibiscus syriacus]
MSFGGFFDNSPGGGFGCARILADISFSNNMPHLVSPSLPKNIFNSPGLSLALQQPSIDNRRDGVRTSENFEASFGRRSREEEQESSPGSDNIDGVSGDDEDAADNRPRKKRYHRHTPQQIQGLEAYGFTFMFSN